MVGIAGQGCEPEMLVESTRFIVLGVNRESPDAGNVGHLKGSLHRILEQTASQSLALPRCRDGQAREQHDRQPNRISRQEQRSDFDP